MVAETHHAIIADDARSMNNIGDDSVEAVITSPPYPMVEMWDDLFRHLDEDIGTALDAEDGDEAFEQMHRVLDAVWDNVERVLVDGGIAAIVVGNATRSIGDTFQLYPNRSRIISTFRENGFHLLPSILWQKPTNTSAKYMGSGCIPPNQYATLEHEHILIFRNGEPRSFEPNSEQRYESAYFYEERNKWFSDHWTDVGGVSQAIETNELDGERDSNVPELITRTRSGAFPFTIPYRLTLMLTLYGDTVLDPFTGTGTTNLAAAVSGRNSIGIELNEELIDVFNERVGEIPETSRDVLGQRIDVHQQNVTDARGTNNEATEDSDNYPFPVFTQQTQHVQLYEATDIHPLTVDTIAEQHPAIDEPTMERSLIKTGFRTNYQVYDRSIPTRLFRYEK